MRNREFSPNLLPMFERDVIEHSDELLTRLSNLYADPAELHRAQDEVELLDPPLLDEYLQKLTTILDGDTDGHLETVYRAFHLAVAVASLSGCKLEQIQNAMIQADVLEHTHEVTDARAIMIEAGREYLEYFPELYSIIGEYMPDINRTTDKTFYHEAEAVYALTLQAIDRCRQRDYLLTNYSLN